MLGRKYRISLRKPNLTRRDVAILAVSLLVSSLIWFGVSLGQPTSAVVTVPVQVRTNIKGRSALSAGTTNVSATVKVSGYRLLWNKIKGDTYTKTIKVDSDAFTYLGSDSFGISSQSLGTCVSELFGRDVTLVEFGASNYQFRFIPESYKKVPVTVVSTITCNPQYMAVSDLRISPDSVLVYGEPARLEGVQAVRTKKLRLEDINASSHGVVALDVPYGMRLSEDEVSYDLDVRRFVETTKTVNLDIRHLPAGKKMALFPATVDVSLRTFFPPAGEPFEGASFYVDYNEFNGSMSGQCVVHYDVPGRDMLNCRVYPEVVECFEL